MYAQRLEVGPQVDRSPRGVTGEPVGFDLSLSGLDPSRPVTAGRPAWTMAGSLGTDHLSAALAPDEATTAGIPDGLGLDLALQATKEPALHDTDGWIDFGAGGGSYYYSRTAMTAAGTLTLDGRELQVTGQAWFDHQWGDFISVGGGGWDWFAVNLADGTDITLSLVRDADGSYPLVYGTVVDAIGTARHLPADAFTVAVTRALAEPGDRRGLPGRLDRHDPIRAAWSSGCSRRSPRRSSTRGRRPASSTGRGRSGSMRRGAASLSR